MSDSAQEQTPERIDDTDPGFGPVCRYCGKQSSSYVCMNSRDMEDFAIDGDEKCFTALERHGWGEKKGERYVRLNRADRCAVKDEIIGNYQVFKAELSNEGIIDG